ncbi:sensor histidine kinase [Nocardiopsis kunsanensis]|uniref:sensor histidine kinase n=1 Tax=Nocardiopsis kunsanensis TaxID=141693 RepID=UPI0004763D48|nr:histidine kinase [Nocardiopsis kunsanensis]
MTLRRQVGGRLISRARRAWTWWWNRRERLADWLFALVPMPFVLLFQALVAVGGEMGFVGGLLVDPETGRPLWDYPEIFIGMALYALPGAAVLALMFVRRSRPQLLLAASGLLLLLTGNFLPAGIALYSYAGHFTNRRLLACWFGLHMAALVAAYSNIHVVTVVFFWGMFLVVPTVLGLWVGTRRQLVERLQERAARLEREQHLMAEQAISSERTRIAREMHDVVAHRVSLMVLHAGGLEVSAQEEESVQTAGVIRTTGREALSELRGILGVLRDEETDLAPTAPQPVLADLDRLLEEWGGAGMDLHRHESGDRNVPVPEASQRTAYRVVQEGLTNVAKHAVGATVTVNLHHGTDRLEIEVANTPAPAPATFAPPPRSGYGLAGLRERVALIGGSLSAAPCPDGGWRMRAIVPTDRTDTEEGDPHGDPRAAGR